MKIWGTGRILPGARGSMLDYRRIRTSIGARARARNWVFWPVFSCARPRRRGSRPSACGLRSMAAGQRGWGCQDEPAACRWKRVLLTRPRAGSAPYWDSGSGVTSRIPRRCPSGTHG